MSRKFLAISMVAAVVLIAALLGVSWYQSAHPSFNGSLNSPLKPAPGFTLTDQSGKTVKLSDFQGKYVLIYFGFTNCTEECPLTMGYLKQMYDKLGAQANQVQVIMITSDPKRDTPEALANFLGHFDPAFIGLTSTRENLQPVWSSYGVTVLDSGETHSSYLYLVDRQGNLMATYPLLSSADGIAADLEHLISTQ